MSLKLAITALEQEMALMGQGTPAQPKEGSVEWFILRARAAGLSLLRDMDRKGLGERPAAAERTYREQLKILKAQKPALEEPESAA